MRDIPRKIVIGMAMVHRKVETWKIFIERRLNKPFV